MKTVWLHRAVNDEVEAAVAWYESQSTGRGLEFLAEYSSVLAQIQSAPENSSPHDCSPFRYRTLKRFPYSVCFLDLPDCVWIMAVPHHKRDSGYWQNRTPGDP